MTDMSDDWMNPKTSVTYTYREPENKMVYAIERQKRTICFGNPGSITEWVAWSTHETKEARDHELERLRVAHPVWQLRSRDYNPYLERLGVS